MSAKKTKRARACDISEKVKGIVFTRDEGKCVLCGSAKSCLPSAHYISRAHGGLGIPENIVTLCTAFGNDCHNVYDNGSRVQREAIRKHLREHLMKHYPHWREDKLIYRKQEQEGSPSTKSS